MNVAMVLVDQGEDLLWNDYEVKLLDQAVRTMESYVSQFPDVRVRHEEVGHTDRFDTGQQTPAANRGMFYTHTNAGENLQKGEKTGRLRLLPPPLGGAAGRQEEGRHQD